MSFSGLFGSLWQSRWARLLGMRPQSTAIVPQGRRLHNARWRRDFTDDDKTFFDDQAGDVMEALLGAEFIDNGFAQARGMVHLLWRPALESGAGKAKHPKSALQEWAAGNQRRPPEYELVDRSGPDHAAKFTVRVKVHKVGEAVATAGSKQEAEKQAAREFMEKFG